MKTSMTTPLISVIIPTYNRATTIEPTLLSVKAQEFTNFECIVVDDGSSDVALLEMKVAELNDARFRVVRRENGGGGAARNTGIDAARGDWIAFLDSDDLYLPTKLSVYSSLFSRCEPKTVLYSQNLVDRGVERKWVRPSRAIRSDEDVGEYIFVTNNFIQTSTIVLQAKFIKSVMFDPTLRKGQDLDLCIRLAADGALFEMVSSPQSIWIDQSELGRTSRHRGYEAPLAWLKQAAPLMTKRAVIGYRATTLAYYMAQQKPFLATYYILNGFLRGGVPLSITIRQLLRAFVPRSVYRRMVNFFVRNAGV